MLEYLILIFQTIITFIKWILGFQTIAKSRNNNSNSSSGGNTNTTNATVRADEGARNGVDEKGKGVKEKVEVVESLPPKKDEFEKYLRFDKSALDEITGGEEDVEKDLIATYIESSQQELEKLKKAIEADNPADSELYSHSIKGAARYVGATKVAERSFQIEKLSKSKLLEDVKKLIDDLEIEIIATNKALEQFQKSKNIN
eukprot:TRINITY_DN4786_c0_g1_i1.p1 TRINITY_DN4786_c0_g1~~TRINITY_DN4786_c0_g1_i1.p1  ORF type:complete len:201 (+),score=71.33 TRINITY_DN4786_c0_g1_i1:35-637(+)